MASASHWQDRVDALLADSLSRETGVLAEVVGQAVRAGGKRLRPSLAEGAADALLGFGAGSAIPPGAADRAAAAAELVHLGSILHDDVIDGAGTRRGAPAAWTRIGTARAVLAGDFALTLALRLVDGLPGNLVTRLTEVIHDMVETQALEIARRDRCDGGVDGWALIARGKTARLCGWAAAAPGWIAGLDAQAARWEAAGLAFGLAYQAWDDLADLVPGENPDKPPFADLRTGTASLPIVAAAARDPGLAEAIARFWEGDRADPTPLAARILAASAGPSVAYVADRAREADRACAGGAPGAAPGLAREVLRRAHAALGRVGASPGTAIPT